MSLKLIGSKVITSRLINNGVEADIVKLYWDSDAQRLVVKWEREQILNDYNDKVVMSVVCFDIVLETQKKEKWVYIKPFSTGVEGIKRIYMEETDKEDKVYKVPETTGLTSVWQTVDTTSNDMIYNESDTTSEERRWSPSEGGDHLCGEDTRKRCWLNGR